MLSYRAPTTGVSDASTRHCARRPLLDRPADLRPGRRPSVLRRTLWLDPVSYTHLRAHETRHDLVCRLLLEKKKKKINKNQKYKNKKKKRQKISVELR